MAMKLTSRLALVDVQRGRRELLKAVGGQGFGGATGKRIPVTITGYVVGAHGRDDGASQEFEVEVSGLTVGGS